MKVNLSGWYHGRITLGGKVLDISRKEIRPLTNESDLKKYYNECVSKLEKISPYFEDKESLEKTIEEVRLRNIPHFKAMDLVYPNLFVYLYNFLKKESKHPNPQPHNKSLYKAHYTYLLTIEKPFDELYDNPKDEGIEEVPEEKYEDYPRIEIPNDRTRAETKISTYHETLHHVILLYKMKSKRLLTNNGEKYPTKKERRIAEYALQEKTTKYLTDRLLEDDKEALFEYRWGKRKYEYPLVTSINDVIIFSSIALMLSSMVYPRLLLFVPLPLAGKYYISDKYKNSKRDEILSLDLVEDFKI